MERMKLELAELRVESFAAADAAPASRDAFSSTHVDCTTIEFCTIRTCVPGTC